MVHDITWLTPSGAPSPDRGRNSVEDTASHLGPVFTAVQKKARSMGREADAILLLHRRQGHAKIEVGRFRPRPGARSPDWYVYLQDPDPGGKWHGAGLPTHIPYRSAMSMEFGWTQTHAFGKKLASPIPHDGLHILGGVMDRAAARYGGPR